MFRCEACAYESKEPGYCPHDGSQLSAAGHGHWSSAEGATLIDRPGGPLHERRNDCPAPGELQELLSASLVPGSQRVALAKHVVQCQRCREELGAAAAALDYNTLPTVTGAGATARLPVFPHQLGAFELLEEIGSGGMGVVYRARDSQAGMDVALKVSAAGSEELERRLQREGHMLARIEHRNVVRVVELGCADGLSFVAMELVAGETLRRWLQIERRSMREILLVFSQAAAGLAAVHDAGVLHRDFKPTNVLVEEDGTARVMDFGLARLGPGSVPGMSIESTMTAEGAVVGTPRYMSPEQLAGLPLDERSDQFSFFVALFEAIFGRGPFAGETPARLRVAALRGQLHFPDRPALSRDLQHLLWRGLRPKPQDRHPSLAEVHAQLVAMLGSG